jgi:TatA/E family protein of Tat protein translocase
MPSLGAPEILVVLLVALLVFGPNKLPEVGRQVGRGLRELRKLQDAVKGELDQVMHGIDLGDEPDQPVVTPAPPAPIPSAAPLPAASSPAPPAPPHTKDAGHAAHAPSRFRAPRRAI